MPPIRGTVLRPTASNLFTTVVWYGHPRTLSDRKSWIAPLASRGIGRIGYPPRVPANRIGFTVPALPQLPIVQGVNAPLVFAPSSVYYMKQPLRLDGPCAGVCPTGAVSFTSRSS